MYFEQNSQILQYIYNTNNITGFILLKFRKLFYKIPVVDNMYESETIF